MSFVCVSHSARKDEILSSGLQREREREKRERRERERERERGGGELHMQIFALDSLTRNSCGHTRAVVFLLLSKIMNPRWVSFTMQQI